MTQVVYYTSIYTYNHRIHISKNKLTTIVNDITVKHKSHGNTTGYWVVKQDVLTKCGITLAINSIPVKNSLHAYFGCNSK